MQIHLKTIHSMWIYNLEHKTVLIRRYIIEEKNVFKVFENIFLHIL